MPSSRVLLIDDNVRNEGGHFYELMTLLATAAEHLGHPVSMATHQTFRPTIAESDAVVDTRFRCRRMVQWSMGVDGKSALPRDITGRTIGSTAQRMTAAVADRLARGDKQPASMLRMWSEDFSAAVTQFRPTADDRIVLNTADDFCLLALGRALRQWTGPKLTIDAVVHFALVEPKQDNAEEHLRAIGSQIRQAILGDPNTDDANNLRRHTIRLHATTDALADQYRRTDSGLTVRSVPYPTRLTPPRTRAETRPMTILMAGLPRAEKGRESIGRLLTDSADLFRSKSVRFELQLPADRWKSIIPAALHHRTSVDCETTDHAIAVRTANLPTDGYHRWLDDADVGLFLYEPDRYVARASGVLLEMMVRGVPVIVPDHCQLAKVVRDHGGHRAVGLIYQNRDEIPGLIAQVQKHRTKMIDHCRIQSRRIAAAHNAVQTLQCIGLENQRRRAA